MNKLMLVKTIIMAEIKENKPLVNNACQNELLCFQDYLIQKKTELEKLPESHLEALVNGLELRKVA
jgi:hypothetical protein